jgi:hypothetical protein
MRWLHEQGIAFGAATMQKAARQGWIELVQYLCAEGCPWDESVTAATCEIGQLDTLRWLLQQGCPMNVHICCFTAAARGSADSLEFLQGAEPTAYAILLQLMLAVAGVFGQLETAQHLRQQGAEWPPVLSIQDKHWTGEVLAWARAEGCTSPVLL